MHVFARFSEMFRQSRVQYLVQRVAVAGECRGRARRARRACGRYWDRCLRGNEVATRELARLGQLKTVLDVDENGSGRLASETRS
jgi:hypothetical protein